MMPGRQIIKRILTRLSEEYPDAGCSLDYGNEFELLVAVVLSAQCTDAKVNKVLPRLFARYPDARALASARVEDVEEIVKPLGLYRTKAKNIVGLSQKILSGVPRTMEALTALPGVGRKTANVVLSEAFEIHRGIAVDTHCGRLARRLGLSASSSPTQVERDLMRLVPEKDWHKVTHLFIAHGRKICKAPRPLCEACVLKRGCPSRGQIATLQHTGKTSHVAKLQSGP